ncbi:hypothetical protein [Hyphomicrobium sp.]|uniref:peptidoglycan-binding domain-containing protein n=1 Tax=Hyphomicrobium sp. TaxID=82 RepID=UPI003F6F9E3E
MRWYFSYPVLAAGLAFGVHTYLPQDHARVRRVEAVPAPPPVEAIDLASVEIADPSRLASFAPDARLFAVAESTDDAPATSVLDYLARTLSTGSFAPAVFTPTAPQQPVTAPEWKSAVVLDVRDDETIAPTQPRTVLSPRVSLTRDIQRELKRVGCYVGDIDGVWGGGSKQAIVLFMDRVNASLPTQEPDVFMLSLLRAENTAVCGTSCPSGQSLTGSGRCVPSTLMVQNERGGQRLQRVAHAALAPATADEEPDRSFEPTSATWDPVVKPAAAKAPSVKASAVKAGSARRVPLEGRMAIGGPVPPTDAAAAIQTGSLQRTAALEPQDTPPQDSPLVDLPPEAPTAAVRPTSFDSSAVVDRPARVTGARPKAPARAVQQRRGTSTYRHVQRLFQHPLGSL